MKNEENTNKTVGKVYEYMADYNSDLEVHDNYITDFDAFEAMLISKTYDSVSRRTNNGITDSDAATMIIERAARVVGQLPEGLVVAAGKKDKGKSQLMNILLQKWVYPNANAQRPFLEKIREWEKYSSVYGVMPMYYDWDVSPTGYVGPNCWLWHPRNFIPQQGRYSIADMDYVHAISYLGKKEVEDLIKNDNEKSGWNKENLEQLLELTKNASKDMDTSRTSYVERQRNSSSVKDRLQVVTRYEAGEDGHWVTFSPDFGGLELRDIKNPHKNSKIPFVIKPCIPLFDNFYGLSDMARAKPIQFAKDGLTNFYFQGIKMNIYPPTVVNAQGILKHTVSNEPGAVWEEIIPNSARRLETSTAGLATYQAAMGQMGGALQNVFGTTTTQLNAENSMSPQFGKTPEAIKYQSGRESARDNQNRAYLQQAIEQLVDGMMSLFTTMATEEIPLDLFSEDIMEIQKAGYQDVMEMILPNESNETGRLIIKPSALKGVEYRFNMEPDSTIKADKDSQKASLLEFMGVLAKNANVLTELQASTGKAPNWEQIIQSYVSLADIPGIDKVFIDAPVQQDQQEPPKTIAESIKWTPADLTDSERAQALQLGGIQPDQQGVTQNQQAAQADLHNKQAQTLSALTEQEPQQQQPESPLVPQSINGMLFHDPTIQAMATDLHSNMRGTTGASK